MIRLDNKKSNVKIEALNRNLEELERQKNV